jgi:hypothetical protein
METAICHETFADGEPTVTSDRLACLFLAVFVAFVLFTILVILLFDVLIFLVILS